MSVVEAELSRFAAELSWEELPESVRERVVDIWADAVANAIAGRCAANTAVVERLAGRLSGPGESTIIGGAASSATGAALVNGYQITAFTMCDVYRPALCHVTPEVLPAVLALAEAGDGSGRDMLTALAVGLEVTTRLGLGVDYPVFRRRGWHSPGVIGTIGAAAAGARVLGLDERGTRHSMGLGMSQAAGTFAALGTPAVKFHQARGAVSGLWAASFAADGLGGPERFLTHLDGGLLGTYADGGRPELVTDGLGERWELQQISLRRWPAASSLQSLVAGMLDVDVGPESVSGIEIVLPPMSYTMCADMGWQDELSAMQSARYVAAVLLHDRRCWIGQFDASRRGDPGVDEFARNQVTVGMGEDLPPSGVEIRIVRLDGSAEVVRRDSAPGEPADPLTRAQICEKLVTAGGEHIVDTVFDAGSRPATEVIAALRAASSPETERSDSEYAGQQ